MSEHTTTREWLLRATVVAPILLATAALAACRGGSAEEAPTFGPEDAAYAKLLLCSGQRVLRPTVSGEPASKELKYQSGTTNFEGKPVSVTEALRKRGGIVQIYDDAKDASDPTATAATGTVTTLPDGRKVVVTNAHALKDVAKPVIFSQHGGANKVVAPTKICVTAHNEETDLDLAVLLLGENTISDPPFKISNNGCTDGGVMIFAGLPLGREPSEAVAHPGYSTWVQYPNGCGLVTGIDSPLGAVAHGDSGGPVMDAKAQSVNGIIYAGTQPLDAKTVTDHTGKTFPGSPIGEYTIGYYIPANTVKQTLAAAQEAFK
jgi:hypothetical protein